MRRLSAVSLSPIYSSFSEAAAAAPSIRAYALQQPFMDDHERRVGDYQRASLSSAAAAAWLSLRLQALAALVVLLVAGLAVASAKRALPFGAAVSAGERNSRNRNQVTHCNPPCTHSTILPLLLLLQGTWCVKQLMQHR